MSVVILDFPAGRCPYDDCTYDGIQHQHAIPDAEVVAPQPDAALAPAEIDTGFGHPCGYVCGIPKDRHRAEEHPWVSSLPRYAALRSTPAAPQPELCPCDDCRANGRGYFAADIAAKNDAEWTAAYEKWDRSTQGGRP